MKIITRRRKTQKILILAAVIAALGTGYYIVRAASWGFTGFSWIGNNLQNGVEQGDPVIGMIGMKGANYNVAISGDGDQRPLVGSAWMGIGSLDDKFNDFSNQNDNPSLGWIHFNQSFDQAKLSALVSGNCYGAGDCYGARWNKKPGSAANSFEGFLSGWARMEIGPNGDGTAYPDTWVHFKAPGDVNNYACNEGDKNYFVCVDANGKLEGYAWSAGGQAVSVDGNPGLGWIKFSKKFSMLEPASCGSDGVCVPNCTPQDPDCVVSATSHYCTVLLDSGSQDQTCKNAGDFTGEFHFKAYQTGFTLNDPDKNYQWTCQDGDAPKAGEKVVCSYKNAGTYSPQLKIFDEKAQQWFDCEKTGDSSVKVTTDSACKVLVRKAGSDNDYENKLSLSPNDTIDAKIDRQCLEGGEVKWTVSGGSSLAENGDKAQFKPAGADTKVSAQVQKDGKTYNCGSAQVGVKETVKWR